MVGSSGWSGDMQSNVWLEEHDSSEHGTSKIEVSFVDILKNILLSVFLIKYQIYLSIEIDLARL